MGSMAADTIVKPERRANSKEKRLESGIRCLLTQNGLWISSKRRMMTAPPRFPLPPLPLPLRYLPSSGMSLEEKSLHKTLLRGQIIIKSFPPKEAIDCQTASPPTSCRVKSVQNLPTTHTVRKRISSNLPRLAWLKQKVRMVKRPLAHQKLLEGK